MKSIKYITYQFFPNEKANTLQTVHTLNSLVEKNFKVKLIFPDREKPASNKKIDEAYEIDSRIEVIKTKHYLPFGKLHFGEKFLFIFSSLVWSVLAVFKYVSKKDTDIVYTRTQWILLCSLFRTNKFIYECHKYSLSLKLVLRLVGNKNNVILIFTNSYLKDYFNLKNQVFNRSLIIPSSFSEKMYNNKPNSKKEKNVVFVGNFLRFNKDRNISFLIKAFQSKKLSDFKLTLVGGPNDYIENMNTNNYVNINFTGQVSNKEAVKIMLEAEIGILKNSNDEIHSYYHTSPLKFFEYIRAGLKVVAVNFPSHKLLPFKNNITFFEKENQNDFIEAVIQSSKSSFNFDKKINDYSYDKRTELIISELARLEGLEPPTT